MVAVPFPAFEPDKHRFNMAASPSIINAVPKVDGWGPLKSTIEIAPAYDYLTDQSGNRLTDQSGNLLVTGSGGAPITGSSTLPAACLGLYAARKINGIERIFAFTATKIYELSSTLFTWQDVSRVSGGNYTGTGRWSVLKFGSYVYASNGTDAEQMIELEAGTKFAPNTSAPIAKYSAVVDNFVFRGNVSGTPAQVQWSALNNPQSNSAGVDQSDFQNLPTGDEVMGVAPMSFGAFIIMRSAIHAANKAITSEYVFTFTEVDGMHGTSAPWSICQIGQDDFIYYSDDGFWRYKGGWSPVGSGRVNLWFLGDCDQQERENIVAMADPENEIVWFAYTDTTGTRKMLGYDYVDDRWCLSSIQVQASARARTFAYTVDGSAVLEDGLLRFAVISQNGKLGYLYGSNLAATLETNETTFNGTNRAMVNGGRLAGDATNFTTTLKVADYKGGSLTAKAAITPSSRTKFISLRGDGRVHKVTVNVPAAATWTTIEGIDLDVVGSGRS